MKRFAKVGAALSILLMLGACAKEADVASKNLSTAADMFQVQRRIVFYNGITGQYMLVIEGLCSLGNADKAKELSVTCKVGPTEYKKSFLGLSDNVTYFVEQVEGLGVSPYHYKVILRPEVIVPSLEIK